MAKLTLQLAYHIELADAKQRLEKERLRLSNYLSEQGGTGAATWHGDKLNISALVFGSNIEGTLTLVNGIANLDANVPFPLLLLRGKLETRLRKLLKVDAVA